MTKYLLGCMTAGLLLLTCPGVQGQTTLNVPAVANPWLAGMPNGFSVGGDTAPAESPAQVTGLPLNPGQSLNFSVSGTISHANYSHNIYPFYGPDGGPDLDGHWYIVSLTGGAVNGIGDTTMPVDSLIGLFLDNNQPSLSLPPSALDFSTPLSRDFLTLAPQLRQPFFIGDGLTSLGVTQEFMVPAGATRLYLATMDVYGWSDNVGSFSVTVAPVPEPASVALLLSSAGIFLLRRSVRREGANI